MLIAMLVVRSGSAGWKVGGNEPHSNSIREKIVQLDENGNNSHYYNDMLSPLAWVSHNDCREARPDDVSQ